MSTLSTDLLSQAQSLAVQDPNRPKQASLRRSISASYYSLFHFLLEESTKLLVGTGQELQPLRHLTCRAFNHTKMKATCSEVQKPTPKQPYLHSIWKKWQVDKNTDLQQVAEAFVNLQELRHTADYDLSSRITRQDALSAREMAAEGMASWKKLRETAPKVAHLFAVILLAWPGFQRS